MHKNFVIHRDIKPENIVLVHVIIILFREFLKYAILVGPSTAPKKSGPLSAALPYTYPLKFWKETHTIKK